MSYQRKKRLKFALSRFSNRNFICYIIALPINFFISLFTVVGRYFADNSKKIALSAACVLFLPVFSSFSMLNSKSNFVPVNIDFGIMDSNVSFAVEEEISLEDLYDEEITASEEIVLDAVDGDQAEIFFLEDIFDEYLDLDHEYLSDGSTSEINTSDENLTDFEFDPNDWRLILVNKSHFIPEDYTCQLANITSVHQCDARILDDLLAMFQAAKNDGINIAVRSPYRSSSYQVLLYDAKIDRYMKKGMSYLESYKVAGQAVTIPGTSEHEIGLSLDIVSDTYTTLSEGFGETAAGKWLAQNAHYYGFILRYPADKEYITTIEYEPWHFRYVGVKAATVIYENNLTLEEFWEMYLE